ncbi:PREDICTED: YEATS domain-containing protein 2-like [Amphimedon queenslandica]|uniref:YEATS domain-containing protein n=1 Tax=Amphimedon queenslandica TaxID=400682 RepID=A0A1X7VFF4_AMPQE|nr:PREDICTED: YEATS domain-containing protein 2-like [Amphimedon queenslandica]|eukprot:XP_019849104.1 PREDICTED: YEATS domain-containing protein 2-like [Amphimedon queenslandica]
MSEEKEKVKTLLLQALTEEESYKTGELEEVEMKIMQTKIILQKLRLSLLCRERELTEQHQSWSQFEEQFERLHGKDEQKVQDKDEDILKTSIIMNGTETSNNIDSTKKELTDTRQKPSDRLPLNEPEENESRFYIKRSIVVGNTSQYLLKRLERQTSERVTHKWMTYVRSMTDQPPLESYVKSITFFLHPTYAPNDIITISRPPYQLIRFGWGEFPVRVQLQFIDPLNKPIDVLHPLKLDQTHSGEQMLGAETIANIQLVRPQNNEQQTSSLYQAPPPSLSPPLSVSPSRISRSLSPPSSPPISLSSFLIPSLQASPSSSFILPCLSSLPSSPVPSSPLPFPSSPLLPPSPSPPPPPVESQSCPPSPSYVTVPITLSANAILLDHDYHRQTLVRRKEDVPLPKPVPVPVSPSDDNMLHVIVRQFPLYGSDYTFSAFSLEQYNKWSLPKQRSSEWMRAVAIKECIKSSSAWIHPIPSTREIVKWCCSHGYTPLKGGERFCKVCGTQISSDEFTHQSCYEPVTPSLTEVCTTIQRLCTTSSNDEDSITSTDIDVLSISDPIGRQLAPPVSDIIYRTPQSPALRWINMTASEVGVVLHPVSHDRMLLHVVDHMIFSACSQFLCQLVRRAVAIETDVGLSERILVPLHVYQAVHDTPLFDFLRDFGVGALGK